jgi:hypothetical protein
MAWLHNGRRIKVGKSFTDDNGITHPRNWSTVWSDEDKASIPLVWQDDPVVVKYDNRFYNSSGIGKSLDDINVVDEDGNAVIDPMTGVQQVQLGLKSQWIIQTKVTANEKLKVHDWQVTRKYEKAIDIDSDVATYRDAVRSACNTIENSIIACADLDAFKALFEVPTDADGNPTGNAPIYNFPDEI